jgi:hypothetical protein
LIRNVDGLSDTDARKTATVSSLSLLSLIKHSAVWERRWFQIIFAGRSFPEEWPAADEAADATFELSDGDTVESVLAYYREQIAVSRQITASVDSTHDAHGGTWWTRTCVGGDAPDPGDGPGMRATRTSSGRPSTAATDCEGH